MLPSELDLVLRVGPERGEGRKFPKPSGKQGGEFALTLHVSVFSVFATTIRIRCEILLYLYLGLYYPESYSLFKVSSKV